MRECEFLRSTKDGDHVSNYLKHIKELVVINVSACNTLVDVITLLKAKKPEYEYAINLWFKLQDPPIREIELNKIIGEDKYMSFNFF